MSTHPPLPFPQACLREGEREGSLWRKKLLVALAGFKSTNKLLIWFFALWWSCVSFCKLVSKCWLWAFLSSPNNMGRDSPRENESPPTWLFLSFVLTLSEMRQGQKQVLGVSTLESSFWGLSYQPRCVLQAEEVLWRRLVSTQRCFLSLFPGPSTRAVCALKRQQNTMVKNITLRVSLVV